MSISQMRCLISSSSWQRLKLKRSFWKSQRLKPSRNKKMKRLISLLSLMIRTYPKSKREDLRLYTKRKSFKLRMSMTVQSDLSLFKMTRRKFHQKINKRLLKKLKKPKRHSKLKKLSLTLTLSIPLMLNTLRKMPEASRNCLDPERYLNLLELNQLKQRSQLKKKMEKISDELRAAFINLFN